MFPSEYLHRLRYDSMTDPALVHPRVSHGPWTYEPHAQDRTLSSPFFYFGICISFVFSPGFAYFFYICLGISSAFILGSCILYPSAGFVLVPLSETFSATSRPQYEVRGNL